jgi:hypothetical protein
MMEPQESTALDRLLRATVRAVMRPDPRPDVYAELIETGAYDDARRRLEWAIAKATRPARR